MVFVFELLGFGRLVRIPYLWGFSGKQPISAVERHKLAQLPRCLLVGEADPCLLFHERHSLAQPLRANALHQLRVRIALEARDNLAVASPVEVFELARGPPRVVDRAAARKHQAERAGHEARRDAGESRALVPVASYARDDRLVQAPKGVVSGVLAARLRERGVTALRELLGPELRDV